MAISGNCPGCTAWAARQRQPLRDVLGPRCPFPQFANRFAIARGQYLFHQGDPVKGGFSIASGVVALERLDVNGSLVILKIFQPGAFFPCSNLLGEAPHETSARALSDVTGCIVPVERLDAALRDDPSIGLALLRLSSAEIRENEDTIFQLHRNDLGDRMLATLTALADEMGESEANGDISLTLPLSWGEVAAMIGTSPEVISRLLRRLSAAGRLTFHGRKVTLHPTAKLQPLRLHHRQGDAEDRALARG